MSIADMEKKVSFGYTPYMMEEGALGAERSQNLGRALSNQLSKL